MLFQSTMTQRKEEVFAKLCWTEDVVLSQLVKQVIRQCEIADRIADFFEQQAEDRSGKSC